MLLLHIMMVIKLYLRGGYKRMIKVSELKQWDVVSITSGKNLGSIKDIEIDLENGTVAAITVAGTDNMFSLFSKNGDLVIPWENIVKVGEDVVLVETDRSYRYSGEQRRGRGREKCYNEEQVLRRVKAEYPRDDGKDF